MAAQCAATLFSDQITCRCTFRAGRSGFPGLPRVARLRRRSPDPGPRTCACSAPCRRARKLSIAIEAPLCLWRVTDPARAFGRRYELKVQWPTATARSRLRRSRTAVSIASWLRPNRRHSANATRALGPFGRRGALRRLYLVLRNAELLRLRNDAQIGLGRFPAGRVFRLGLLVGNRRRNDDVLTLLPVHRRGDNVLRRELDRIK